MKSVRCLIFAVGLCLVPYSAPAALAATFTVNSTADVVDAFPGDGVCDDGAGNCTLRAAIQEANALPGADTILLPAGVYTRTLGPADPANTPSVNPDASGDFDITGDLTITGDGEANTIIDANGIDRVFHVLGGAVSISGVSIQGGNPPGGCVADFSQWACAAGGGVCVKGGTVTVTDSRITGNYGCQGAGAEIGTALTLNRVTVSGNNGRGLQGNGGGYITLLNSTVSGNNGFGIFSNGGATLTNSTVSGNGDTGIFTAWGAVNLNNVTITSNPEGLRSNSSSYIFNMKNTILAGNANDCSPYAYGTPTIISQGYNLIQNTTGCVISGDTTGNQTEIVPNLGPLQDNGGPTFTHALLTGSPAIDAGNPAAPGSGGNACAADDQRGVARPQDGDGDTTAVCDIGAYELVPSCQPSVEVCNGVDDDCDGQTDEDLGTLSCGVGACARTVDACVNGQPQTCTPGSPSAEVCDGLDNDCDGTVDQGNPGGGAGCNTGLLGACSAGTLLCTGGALVCQQTTQPAVEICNGVDDDCDGQTDEDLGTLSCGVGACARTVDACVNGQPQTCTPGSPSTEVCDGLDNDCDGTVDEGNPGGGAACNTGLLGVCRAGTLTCTGGALVCRQTAQPAAEVCDGLDNDCDGTADEGNPGGGAACNTGLLGVCSAGTQTCIGGVLRCQQNRQPSTEACNGLDDNCNGRIDESFSGLGKRCSVGVGACQRSGTKVCSADGSTVVCSAVPGTPGVEICGNSIDEDCDGAAAACPPPASITVTNPNGGESWKIGQSRTIKWRSTSVSGVVKIELSRDRGATWATLFLSTPNDGQENWAPTGPATTRALIRISSVTNNPSVVDVSDAVFTIH